MSRNVASTASEAIVSVRREWSYTTVSACAVRRVWNDSATTVPSSRVSRPCSTASPPVLSSISKLPASQPSSPRSSPLRWTWTVRSMLIPPVGGSARANAGGGKQSAAITSQAASTGRASSGRT